MDNLPALSDLNLFCVAARRASFVATANELGKSSAFVSKRIAILEATLNVKLFHRTTRHVAITEEGETVFQWAQQILEAANGLTEVVGGISHAPKGMVRIASSFRLGRRHLAPILSELEFQYPDLEVWLEVTDRPVDLNREGIDIDIRIGVISEPNVIAHRILESKRILCAAPSYLERFGTPRSLAELSQHHCLVLRERDQAFGVWRLNGSQGLETVKATGRMSTNNADIARVWARAGHGILLVSDRDVLKSLTSGELIHILPDYSQPADVWAVCRTRLSESAKLRVCVEYIKAQLSEGPYALIDDGRQPR